MSNLKPIIAWLTTTNILYSLGIDETLILLGVSEDTLFDFDTPEDILIQRERHNILVLALESLDPRSMLIMDRLIFGEKTLEAVGEEIGLTRERVRQIEVVATEKVRIIFRKMLAVWTPVMCPPPLPPPHKSAYYDKLVAEVYEIRKQLAKEQRLYYRPIFEQDQKEKLEQDQRAKDYERDIKRERMLARRILAEKEEQIRKERWRKWNIEEQKRKKIAREANKLRSERNKNRLVIAIKLNCQNLEVGESTTFKDLVYDLAPGFYTVKFDCEVYGASVSDNKEVSVIRFAWCDRWNITSKFKK